MGVIGRVRDWGLFASGYLKSFRQYTSKEDTGHYPIDFVVTWVDGNDPAWLRERAEFFGEAELRTSGNGACRYRDWVSFRYWFRAVEEFAPWVRYVHLVTWGHVPEWLNLECPKLKIVNHKDYMPSEFLPTYNCNPLELNLFRIPDLSEHFVYFNDDILLARPVTPEDFFVNGMPKHTGIAVPWINRDNEIPYHLFFNGFGLANQKNNIMECIRRHPEKFFSHVYGSLLKHNIEAFRNSGLPGMYFTHMGVPFCRSSMRRTWEKYEKECVQTCSYRIRDIHQITHQIYSIEDILSGNFVPEKNNWGNIVSIENIGAIRWVYESRAYKMICLSDRDNMTTDEIESVNRDLAVFFEEVFPATCDFEKENGGGKA